MKKGLMRRPARLGPKHAAMYQDLSVALSYQNRAPYPADTIEILLELVPRENRRVLDVGCGTGFIARPLAARVDQLDALDPSAAMIEIGRGLPGGDHPNLRWIQGSAEDGMLQPRYGLVVAASCFHWLQWDVVLPRLADALTAEGVLAIVEARGRGGPDLREIIPRYSTNQDFSVDDNYDWMAELQRRGLLTVAGSREARWQAFIQSFDDFVDGWHSMGGFSRERMDRAALAEFDKELYAILARTYPGGQVEMEAGAVVAWGRPGHDRSE